MSYFIGSWTRDDVMTWIRFPLYWPFVRGIHRSPVDCPHKGSSTRPLMFFCCQSKQTVEKSLGLPVRSLSHAMKLMWCHCNGNWIFTGDNTFSSPKSFTFWFKYHWRLFLMVQFEISKYRLIQWLVAGSMSVVIQFIDANVRHHPGRGISNNKNVIIKLISLIDIMSYS